jgi:thiamine biosynthesis lipoprotein
MTTKERPAHARIMPGWLMLCVLVIALAACSGETGAGPGTEPIAEQAPAELAPKSPAEPGQTPAMFHETFEHAAMGTKFEFTLYGEKEKTSRSELYAVAQQAFQAIDLLEDQISSWQPRSQTTYINHHAFEEPVKVTPEVLGLIVRAKDVYEATDGAFDITVGPLIELWGFYKGEGRLPSDAELAEAVGKVGFDKVTIDRDRRTVSFAQEGLRLDFGGIAKGLALDEAAQVLADYGITTAIIHGGTSSVMAIGCPPREAGWTVRIRDPYNKDGHIHEVLLRDETLSTSGSYEKFFKVDGKEYCHIFDPRTGQPVRGMLSATAIAKNGTISDALSTAFFVMGLDETRAYCEAHPDVRAILIPVPESGTPQPWRVNFPG